MRISDWGSDVCSSDLCSTTIADDDSRRSPTAMRSGAEYFAEPSAPAQRRYEALRAYFVEEAPAAEVAERFGYRSEERRVGKEGVRTCGYRWSPYSYKNKTVRSMTHTCLYLHSQ